MPGTVPILLRSVVLVEYWDICTFARAFTFNLIEIEWKFDHEVTLNAL